MWILLMLLSMSDSTFVTVHAVEKYETLDACQSDRDWAQADRSKSEPRNQPFAFVCLKLKDKEA